MFFYKNFIYKKVIYILYLTLLLSSYNLSYAMNRFCKFDKPDQLDEFEEFEELEKFEEFAKTKNTVKKHENIKLGNIKFDENGKADVSNKKIKSFVKFVLIFQNKAEKIDTVCPIYPGDKVEFVNNCFLLVKPAQEIIFYWLSEVKNLRKMVVDQLGVNSFILCPDSKDSLKDGSKNRFIKIKRAKKMANKKPLFEGKIVFVFFLALIMQFKSCFKYFSK